jgi:hypothetical protein
MGEEKGRLVIRKLFEWLLGGRDQALEILEKTVLCVSFFHCNLSVNNCTIVFVKLTDREPFSRSY